MGSLLLNINIFLRSTSSSSQKYKPIFSGRSDSSNPIIFCHTLQNRQLHHSYAERYGQPSSHAASRSSLNDQMLLQSFKHVFISPGKTDDKEKTLLLQLSLPRRYLRSHSCLLFLWFSIRSCLNQMLKIWLTRSLWPYDSW